MNPNQGREAAYVKSRVKDLSLITNTPDYVGCFACITPKAHSSLDEPENYTIVDGVKVYLPQLVRDVDTLTELFGDPRIDPATYKDFYAIRTIVQNGFACYIAKVKSGEPYTAIVNSSGLFESAGCIPNTQLDDEAELIQLKADLQDINLFNVESSIVGTNKLSVALIPLKPFSINQVVLEIHFTSKATSSSDEVEVSSARIMLTPDTKNADLIKTINGYLGGDISFQLPDILNDATFATVTDASEVIEPDSSTGEKYYCIANVLLYICGLYVLRKEGDHFDSTDLLMDNMELCTKEVSGVTKRGLEALKVEWTNGYVHNRTTFICKVNKGEDATLSVSQADYVRSLSLYSDPKYSGCFISDLSSDVTVTIEKDKPTYKATNYIANSYNEEALPEDYPETTGYLFVKRGDEDDPTTTYDSMRYIADNTAYLATRGLDRQKFTQTSETVGDVTVYTYTPDPSGTFVRKDESNPTKTESVAPDTENSNFVTLEAGVNDKYNKQLYNPNGYTRVNLTSEPSPATDQIFFVKNEDGTAYEERIVANPSAEPPVEGNDKEEVTEMVEMPSDDRRGLHYIIKHVAALRKDLTCVFTTPYKPCDIEQSILQKTLIYEDLFDLNRACNWVAVKGDFTDLFEYGNSQAVDYSEQAFYCEMYWSWLKWRVAKLVNGLATGSSVVIMPPTPFVILNALASYRTKGSFYPVAGDQGGILPDSCTILQNPSTKGQRDKLISYRINPIYDTGLRGIQIYGNDTLNPQYTDLSAAHIARTLVQIRSRVDAYSETIKFSLNDKYTWGTWINYVSTKILDPIRSLGGLQWYQVDMGYNTTTRDEIAQRKIRGMISLQFTQALEIIDLEFVVYSSALDMEATTT